MLTLCRNLLTLALEFGRFCPLAWDWLAHIQMYPSILAWSTESVINLPQWLMLQIGCSLRAPHASNFLINSLLWDHWKILNKLIFSCDMIDYPMWLIIETIQSARMLEMEWDKLAKYRATSPSTARSLPLGSQIAQPFLWLYCIFIGHVPAMVTNRF